MVVRRGVRPGIRAYRARFTEGGGMTSGAMPPSRHTFLHLAGATAFALPATARALGGVPRIEYEVILMEIKRIGTQPSGKGPAEWFTGSVRIDPLFQPHAPARA